MKTAYKIFTPLFSLAVLPALFFLPLLHLSLGSVLTESLSGVMGLKEYSSIFDILKTAGSIDEKTQTVFKLVREILTSNENKLGAAITTKGFLVAAVVFLVLMLVLAILTACFALFSKKQILSVCFALGGALSGVLANKMFDAFAKPFLTGAVSLKNLLSDAGTLSDLIGGLVTVKELELAIAYQVCVLLLGVAAIFGVAVIAKEKFAE